jgi:hypothetical protein
LIVGGKEQTADSIQTSESKLGIPVFRVDVLGTSDRPSNLGTLTSSVRRSRWSHWCKGAYLHLGAQADTPQDHVIEVVGMADASMAGVNVLWLV